jgi:hypothetical protein
MRNENNSDRSGGLTLPRRDFLLLGSVAVAGVAASGLSADVIRAVAGPVGGSVLSIGFTEATAGEESRVGSAQRLGGSDRELASNGARVTIHGYFRPEERSAEPVSVNVTTFYPVAGRLLPVIAWSSTPNRTVHSQPASIAVNVPADSDGGITLGVLRRRPSSNVASAPARRNIFGWASRQSLETVEQLERERSICRLTPAANGVHLRPGTYFIAVGDPARDAAPDWNLAVMEPNGALVQPSLTGRTAVPFEYLTVSVAPLTA